ncbi:Fic family protein [Gulosibacter molinativorax]|uniref:Cell filamentation protein Fic n=1 Tax=Gulosibacter molinativorax TaxID=256821 RepID=A0ABT7C9K9_9MICO|nr:Fic family protein [Gulosibacter molinativorax]MDJ1371883.1 cell filamentation protein Fic [Gulosibacter molinativorax]QUY62532.1 Hypotetical protein [Gulosibacter molinativorax]
MSFDPGYGETPVPFDELDALLPEARASLPEPITRAAVYDLEQAVEATVKEELLMAAFEGELQLEELLSDAYLRELHGLLYRDIWSWAGRYRRHDFNIGIDWHAIPTEMRGALDNIRYRWENTSDWTPRELGIAVHAECVRIHPFVDGNGRSTRLFADLVFAAAQDTEIIEAYDWQIDKGRYIELLRAYDQHRDSRDLAEFVSTYPIS